MADGGPLDRFVAELWRTPVPAAPLTGDRWLELLGLSLFDLTLNQQHVSRMSERLSLIDATHLTRRVSLEIDMATLSPARRAVLAKDPLSGGTRQQLWVPLARQPRAAAGLVRVTDGDGRALHTMSARQVETAMSLGLRRAFNVYLEAPQDTDEDTERVARVRDTLHRSRWLIEATIASVVANGMGEHRESPLPVLAREATDAGAIRGRAEAVVRAIFRENGSFPRMLDIVAREHLLVVEFPVDQLQSTVQYDVRGALETSTRRRTMFRREFTVSYRTVIPRAVDTYDVTVEMPEGIQIRRFFLATAGDRAEVRSLAADMRATADRYGQLGEASQKLLQLELHGIASRLAELGRRRRRDLHAYQDYIAGCYAIFTTRKPRFRTPEVAKADPENVLPARQAVVSELSRFADLYEADLLRHLSHGALGPKTLRAWADELESAALDMSLDFDTDSREHVGHARWQRQPVDDRGQAQTVDADLYMSLVDDPISVSSAVSKLVLAVLLLIAGFVVLLQPHVLDGLPLVGDLASRIPVGVAPQDAGRTISTADAVVTVLLLVPALLITRVQLPPRSVLGRLLIWPRFVAFASVVTAVVLAVCVALLPANALWEPFVVVLVTLAALFTLITGDLVVKRLLRRNRVPVYHVVPAWLHREDPRWPRRRLRDCVANFSSAEREDHRA